MQSGATAPYAPYGLRGAVEIPLFDDETQQRYKLPFLGERFSTSPLPWGPPLSLQEFKALLRQLTAESTEDEMHAFKEEMKRGTRLFYLGSRDEIDYGISCAWTSGRSLYCDGLEEGVDPDYNAMYTRRAFFLHGAKTQETLVDHSNRDSPEKKSITKTPEKPGIERFIEIGPLVTYSDKEGWNDVRFAIVKCIEDGSFWIVGRAVFLGDENDDGDGWESCWLEPGDRVIPLDGFDTPFSCARLKADEESFQFHEGMQRRYHPKRPDPRKPFDIEQVHSGGFVLLRTEENK